MIWLVVCLMLATQILTVMWLFWLDAEFKVQRRYIQGLQSATMIKICSTPPGTRGDLLVHRHAVHHRNRSTVMCERSSRPQQSKD